MSLNGLDDVKVKEAHEAAAAEPGGWFLLKYISRDEVDILGKGNGGIVEIRNAIAAYEEPTPLFGFLRYRRRNVVIKYVPEECSRLVQARVAVHFTAVTERFSPHDTTFSITSSKDLKDSALSSACLLHAASGSTSSSTSSLRRRRLMEITEDEEEDIRAKRQSTVLEERPITAKPFDNPMSISIPSSIPEPNTARTGLSPTATDYRAIIADLETSPPPPREPLTLDDIRPSSPAKTLDERRPSLQSTRPDLFGSNGRPKIKLGPRPSLDVGGRPHTAASGSVSQFRPVSSLPAGLKLTKTPSKAKRREQPQIQQQAHEGPSMTMSPPSIPEDAIFTSQLRPHTSGGRPTTSSGVSIRTMTSPSSMSTKFPLMTPEKARLMKALELRKKRESQAVAVDRTIPKEDLLQASIEGSDERPSSGVAPKEVQDTLQMLNEMAETSESATASDANSTLKTDESDATRSDSYPVSPVGASEKAESTRASSISDSTDGTVQEASVAKPAAPQEDAPGEDKISAEAGAHQKEETDQTEVDAEPDRSTTTQATGEVKEVAPVSCEELVPEPEPTSQQDYSSIKDHAIVVVVPSESLSLESVKPKHEENGSSEIGASSESLKEQEDSTANQPELEVEVIAAEISIEEIPSIAIERTVEDSEHSPVESTFSRETQKSVSKKQKRRAIVEPIRTDVLTDQSATNSDAHFSSDDDLMDELQSAVVQEAMPISVSKSPISPVFPNRLQKGNRFSRTFSNSLRKDKDDSKLLSASNSSQPVEKRSVSASAAYLNKINQQESRPIAKKVNLGSGISQRIKALEKLSSNGPAAAPQNPPAASPNLSTSFFAVRKTSGRDQSTSPSVAERANSISQRTPPPSASRDSSPEVSRFRDRSASVQSRVDAITGSPTSSSRLPTPKTDAIAVTARILGEPLNPKSEVNKELTDFKPLKLQKLQKSPPVDSNQIRDASPPKETIQERRMSRESARSNSKRERRSSITVIKDFISDMSDGRSSFSDRRRSMNLEISTTKSPSLKSPSRPPSTHTSRPISISSRLSNSSRDMTVSSAPPTAGSVSSNGEEKPEKKASRASRMMRRMSSSISSSRKTISHAMSPTVREEFEPPSLKDSPPLQASPTQILNILGDVNVQFPDSLLWKRRSMALDSQGFLILTATGNVKDTKAGPGATRRFHFTEFRMPAIPDVEMQELPNSVVLDFVEGGGLQVACEDRAGQGRVLTVLQDAYRSWCA